LVGAAGVGNMALAEERLETRQLRGGRNVRRVRYDEPRPVQRGDELGSFLLGSTVVLVFEPGRVAIDVGATGAVVRVGAPMARVVGQGDVAAQCSDPGARSGGAHEGEG